MNEIEQYLVDEQLWHYRQGWISRREFFKRAAVLGTGAATAAAMAASVQPARRAGAAPAAQGVSPFSVPEGDPAVSTDWVWYRTTAADVTAYVTWPAAAASSGEWPRSTRRWARRPRSTARTRRLTRFQTSARRCSASTASSTTTSTRGFRTSEPLWTRPAFATR